MVDSDGGDNGDLQVLYGAHGKIKLALDGFVFQRRRTSIPPVKDKMKWNCDCVYCPVALYTTRSYQLIRRVGSHRRYHFPNAGKVELLKAFHLIRQKAVEDHLRKPRAIYNEIVLMFPDIAEYLGGPTTVARMIQVARK